MAFKRGNHHKNNVAMSNLRFSVVACTSEDASFSVSNLNNHVVTNQGYRTTKNCSYPQELILQLQRGLCRVTQVQIMSHETHIATMMELFVSKSLHFDRKTTCFSRVGFLTLQDNTESNYKARELKTVHLDHEMTLLKLRIHGCHDNEHNLYRQVGIMAVNLCGTVRKLLPNHMLDEAVATSLKQKKKKCDDEGWSCDVTMAARIREVQVAKNNAVVSEDYDQAKRLKKMEEQLQAISRKLARLKAQKSEAVANEDYDLAKKVKLEIERVEASVRNNELLPILSKFASSSMRSQVVHTSEAVLSSSLNASSTDMYPEVPRVANSETFYGGSDLSLRHSPQGSYKQDPCYNGDDTDQEDGNDGGPNPQFRGIPGAANLPDPEEIAAGLAKESEELIFVIGPFFTRCFYSNLWNHRDAAIRKVTMEMNKYPVEPKQLLEVCSKLAQSGAGDRIVQVALSAFGLLDRMVSFGARLRHEDMCRILGNSMPQLVNRLGGSQAKIRDEAVAVLGHMAAAKNVGVAFVTSYLIKHSSKPLGIKILQGRLLLLKKLLAEFELVSESDFSAPSIMQFLEDSNSLAHQCREIRDAAKDITVSLYLAVGTEVEGFLKHLRPKQLEEYQAAFETVTKRAKVLNHCSGATAATVSIGSGSRRDEIQCKIEEQFELDVEDMNDSEDKESVDEYTCPFCGVVDEKFDSDYLDQHFWGNCKMLTPCKMCGQVIEISTLNEHLLAECEMQQNHRECPRCGEAIITKFYERHVSLDDCTHRAPLESANRCPLCHDDIAPGEKGWRRHLLDEGCPNNPRR
ncbi:hypothetical protein DD238_005696 [Peronospora effusa]|uniref:TOG domain-containing protein n=1 Tax=Peronospora effusa TaxID=542832 RepID=A0A3M6VF37_9STRA|nr:hypothetical protein DD238_005696 [Peronospora effusa]